MENSSWEYFLLGLGDQWNKSIPVFLALVPDLVCSEGIGLNIVLTWQRHVFLKTGQKLSETCSFCKIVYIGRHYVVKHAQKPHEMNVTLNIIGSIGTTGYLYSKSESVLEKPTLLSHFSLQSLDGRENEKSYWELNWCRIHYEVGYAKFRDLILNFNFFI